MNLERFRAGYGRHEVGSEGVPLGSSDRAEQTEGR